MEANFSVSFPEQGEEDILHTTDHYPNRDTTAGSETFSISPSFGPVSSDLSEIIFPDTDFDHVSYDHVSWKFDYGAIGTTDVPTGIEDTIGVRFDFSAENIPDDAPSVYMKTLWEHDYLFNISVSCPYGDTIVYSSTPEYQAEEYVSIAQS